MANTVDERIVAAKFDASDFEKGVNKTIKKLDELKKSLDMKEATKGVKELAEKTEVSTNSMSKSLDKLTERFTTFTGMVKQKILGGLADEVSGVFLRMEQSVTGFIRSISSDQVRAGMSKYEQMLTSVRIMMSAGESQNEAYKSIDQLREYSDQTSYSLSQMTDALSKMRAAGVDLDTATKSVEGIANACANAGINATDAQRAFYNLSQAYAKGSLNYTDYKSLELLNMTTEKFKENMLEAAVEAGTLKKVSEGTYKTISSTDKKVKAGKKVTVKNLNDMLRYDFMNNEAMNKLFGKKFYFDEKQFKEYKKRYTDGSGKVDREKAIAEAKKDFGAIAVDAYLAAREARSFTDVINTLKDVVSTGWGSTFEYLFGKLDQAKEFFTELAEGELADVVYKIGEYRNAILGFWDDGVNGESGGKVFRQTILNISDALGTLLKTVLQILPGFHELSYEEDKDQPILESLGQKMFDLSMTIRDMSVRVKNAAIEFNNFMNSPMMENGPTRIEMIRSILSNLANVFGIIGKVVSLAFYGISRAFYTLSPIFDAFLVVMQKITEPLVSLRNNSKVFDDIRHSINNVMTILEPIANTLGQIIGFLAEVAGFFAQMAIDTVTANISFFSDTLGLFLELITGKSSQLESGEGILNGIKQDFEGIKEACKAGLGAVKDFFGALIGDIRRLFGLTDEAEKKSEEQEGGIFAGLTNFFATNEFVQQAKAWVNQAIVDVSNFIKSIPERVLSLGSNIYDTITGLFFHEETKYNGSTLETKRILTPLGEWFDQAIKDIKAWFAALPGNIIKAVGDAGKWIDEVFNEWFGHEKVHTVDMKTGEGYDYVKVSKFQAVLGSMLSSIREWFKDLPNKIKNGLKSIGNFATRLFGTIDEFLFGKKEINFTKIKDAKTGKISRVKWISRYKTGFSEWLDGVIKEVKKFINNIPTHINNAIKGVGDIISTVVNALFGKKDGAEEITNKDVEKAIEKPFLGINLSGVLDTIKSVGTTIINQIARIFTGTDDVEKNQEWFSGIIASGIQWIRTKAETALKWVLDFLVTLPSKIADIFKGESKESKEQGPIGKAISDFGSAIGKFITEDLPDAIFGFVNSAIDTIGDLWDKLYKGIVGESEGNTDKVVKYAEDEFGYPKSYAHRTVKTGWEKFVENLGKTISHAFENLPTWIAQGIHLAIEGISGLFSTLSTWLSGDNAAKEMADAAQKAKDNIKNGVETITESTNDGVKESTKDSAENQDESGLLKAIKGIGQTLYNLITTVVPEFIKNAWTWLGSAASNVWEGIKNIFSGEPSDDEKDGAADNIATKIKNFLTVQLPAKMKQVWSDISTLATDIWEGISSIFTGKVPATERAQAIAAIGAKIKDFVINAFGEVSKIFDKENEELYQSATDELANPKKEHIALMNLNKKSGWARFVESIGSTIASAFKDIGPAILNGISKAFDFLGSIVSIIVNALTGKESIGEQIEGAYGKEKPELRKALTNVGESIKKFFLETIPEFIGSAIGALIGAAPKWFEKLFSSLNKASDAARKDAEKEVPKTDNGNSSDPKSIMDKVTDEVSGVFGFIERFMDKIKDIATSDVTASIATVLAIAVVLRTLKDVFSISDEIESAGYTFKWIGITIAIAGIVGILSALTSIVVSGDTEKIKKVEGIIDRLKGLFEKLSIFAGILAAKDFFRMIGNLAGDETNIIKKEKEGFGKKLLGGVGEFFNNALGSLGTMLGVGGGVAIAGDLASGGIETLLTGITNSLTDFVSSLSEVMVLFDPLINQLTGLDTRLTTAISGVNKIKDLFITFYNLFSTLYLDTTGKIVTDAMLEKNGASSTRDTRDIGDEMTVSTLLAVEELQKRMDLYVSMSAILEKIIRSINNVGSEEDMKSKIAVFNRVIGDGSFEELMDCLFAVMDNSLFNSDMYFETEAKDETGLRKMAAWLDIVASSLSIVGESIANFDEKNLNAFDRMLDIFKKLTDALKDKTIKFDLSTYDKAAFGDNSLAGIGKQIKVFSIYLKSFYENIEKIPGFDATSIDRTLSIIDSVVKVFTGFADASKIINSSTEKQSFDFSFLEGLGTYLPSLGTNFASFIETINNNLPNDLTGTRSSILKNTINGVADVITAISNMTSTSIIYKVRTMANELSGTGANDLADAVMKVNQAISMAMTTEKSTEPYFSAGQDIAKRIFDGIQYAFETDTTYSVKITPVLELGPAQEQLKQFFGVDNLNSVDLGGMARAAMGANYQTDIDRVTQGLFNEKLDEVTRAINTISENSVSIGDVTNAFAGMKIVTNTGVLAGEMVDTIDALIGKKIWLIQRGIAPV